MSQSLTEPSPALTDELSALDNAIQPLSRLSWINLFVPTSTARQCRYTPASTGSNSNNHRQLPVPDDMLEDIDQVRDIIKQHTEERLAQIRESMPRATLWDIEPFHLSIEGIFVRITPIQTVDGTEYILRRLPSTVLDESDLQIGKPFLDTINGWLTRPGLTLVGGRYATRKTTHCYAYLKHHLKTYGGVGMIVDAPAEAIFSSEYLPNAHCIQVDLNTHPDPSRKWDQVNSLIRKSSATIVYAGEISDPEAARFLIQQAHTGRPVLANLHGEDIVNIIENLVDLGSKTNMRDYRSALANSLVGVSCQTLVRGVPSMQVLQVSQASSLADVREEDIRRIINSPSATDDELNLLIAASENQTQALNRKASR